MIKIKVSTDRNHAHDQRPETLAILPAIAFFHKSLGLGEAHNLTALV